MSRFSKKQIVLKINESLRGYPLINKYFSVAISNLIKDSKNNVRNLLELNLIRYLFTNDNVLLNLEKYLGEHEFTNINVPIKRLKTKFSEYTSVVTELEVAQSLKDEGMDEIRFIEEDSNPDIQYNDHGIVQYAEVKGLEELDPEFPIIDNKLEATSIIDKRFEKNFYIRLNDVSQFFNKLEDYRGALNDAVDKVIGLLRNEVDKNDLEDMHIKIGNFEFTISFNSKRKEYSLMYSGEVMKYGSHKDIFLKMSSVYSRFINSAAKGIKQLARKRDQHMENIKNDRLYIFLNSGRNANFVPDELQGIIEKISKTLGLNDLVTLKIKL